MGIHPCLEADIKLQPLIPASTKILLEGIGIAYMLDGTQFTIPNLHDIEITLHVDLSGVRKDDKTITLTFFSGEEITL
ncbi:MAG: hypothetical protein GX916_04795 [Clostridiales bacterium]|jgi:hypothetical protein|nr:hypothetical protein [Clostridiales bacterium]